MIKKVKAFTIKKETSLGKCYGKSPYLTLVNKLLKILQVLLKLLLTPSIDSYSVTTLIKLNILTSIKI